MRASHICPWFLADGMPGPGVDLPVPVIFLGMALVFALLTAVARWFGAEGKVAIGITCVPLGLWALLTCLGSAGQHGSRVSMLFITVPIFLVALASSSLTAYLVPQRKGSKSKASPKKKKPAKKKKK